MILYSIQFSLFLTVFLAVYFFFFRKETFFQYNRIYLILAPILAIILPLLSFNFLQEQLIISENRIQLPTILLGEFSSTEKVVAQNVSSTESFSTFLNLENCLAFIYALGCLISCLIFYKKTRKFKKLRRNALVKSYSGNEYYEIPQSRIAFTFFSQIFIGEEIQAEEKQQIMRHEMVHVKQLHSIDLVFFEILKLVFWFHPGIYFCQNQLKTLHEFIADQKVLQFSTKQNYYESLLNSVFNTEKISFINQFFNHSLIKKRIVMLQKTHSTPYKKLKFLLLIPLIFGMLTYVSCSEDAKINETESVSKEDVEKFKKWVRDSIKETQKKQDVIIKLNKNNWEQVILNNKDKFYGLMWLEADEEDVKEISFEKLPEGIENGKFSEFMLFLNKNDGKKIIGFIPYQDIRDKQDSIFVDEFEKGYNKKIPFTEVESVPIFLGCEGLENEAAKKCMAEKVSEFVNSKFDTTKVKPFAEAGTNRIYVRFTIDKNGNIKDVKARAAHPELGKEAEKTINQLPQMQPGLNNGEPVNVLYSLPIIFQVGK